MVRFGDQPDEPSPRVPMGETPVDAAILRDNMLREILPLVDTLLEVADRNGALAYFVNAVKAEIREEEHKAERRRVRETAEAARKDHMKQDDLPVLDDYESDDDFDNPDRVPQIGGGDFDTDTHRSGLATGGVAAGAFGDDDDEIPESREQRLARLGKPFNPLMYLAEFLKDPKNVARYKSKSRQVKVNDADFEEHDADF